MPPTPVVLGPRAEFIENTLALVDARPSCINEVGM